MTLKSIGLKLVKLLILVIISCSLFCGCSFESNQSPAIQWNKTSINTCIDVLNVNYEEIYDLTCNPSDNVSLLSTDYDLLGELVNLEKIKLVGIGSKDDAQNFFVELTKLKNLKTVEIVDSAIGSIYELGNIENLTNLSIIGNAGGGARFSIEDIELLGTDERFSKLQSLSLKFINLETIPNLNNLNELSSLAVSGREITSIDKNIANWKNLITFEISSTSVSSIDADIVKQLQNLQILDVSYSPFGSVSFVTDLSNLKVFKCRGYSMNAADAEYLKQHPNYKDDWLNN